jgi:hypothetical protein
MKLYSQHIYNLYSSSNIVRITNLEEMGNACSTKGTMRNDLRNVSQQIYWEEIISDNIRVDIKEIVRLLC